MPERLDLEKLNRCKRCPRMQRQFRRLRKEFPDHWNLPVPPSGDPDSPLVIMGLAPGMHGANRTGIPFVGDAAGDLLFAVLGKLGLRQKVRISNVVKCLPIANLPNGKEVDNCQRFLKAELAAPAVVLALGGVAHRAVLKSLGQRQSAFSFGHGRIHDLSPWTLVDSYHCSRYNTQTGRLTAAMFEDVVELAAGRAGLLD